jgi:vancomycin permeability regulator SanA
VNVVDGVYSDVNRIFKRRLLRWILLFCIVLITLFAPQISFRIRYKDKIYNRIEATPAQEFAIVFGAWVNEDHSLTGDNRSNQQADEMANYAVEHGVNFNDIIVDKLGIDTNDTCKHFAKIGRKAILVTQGYHLPRTMLMCETSKIDVMGLAADKLGILESRGDNLLQIYTIRTGRSFREAVLTWYFLLGIYDKLSTEAELIEQTGE